MLCFEHDSEPGISGSLEAPQYVGSKQGPEADTAGLRWANRGTSTNDSDNFNATYGAKAEAARIVVQAAFDMWRRVITNFNQTGGNNQLDVTVNAAGRGLKGLGGSGGVDTLLGDKPRTSSITLGGGSDVNGINGVEDAEGFFLDPTPYDNKEFQGEVFNAFSGFAQSGSPAEGKADFFSLVTVELQHALGIEDRYTNLRWRSDPNDYLRPAGTDHANAARDTSETVGKLYYLNSPNVRALYTSFNSGNGGEDRGYAVHSAPSGQTYTTGGVTYRGQADTGAARYPAGRRYMPSRVGVMSLGDIYNYTVTAPETLGTFYAVVDPATHVLNIRAGIPLLGGSPTINNDLIEVRATPSGVFITLDIGDEVAGTNLTGAFTSTYFRNEINTIVVNSGHGSDTIRIETNDGISCQIDAGFGDDFIDFSYYSKDLSQISGNTDVGGGDGYDQIFAYDNNQGSAKTYTITSARFDRAGWGGFFYRDSIEPLNLITGTAADTVNVQSTFTNQAVWLWSAAGADTVNIGNTSTGINGINGSVFINNDPSFTTLNINNGPDTGARTWNVDAAGDYGYLIGMSPALIHWDMRDIASINLTCGSGVDTGQFVISTETFNVNNAGGNDIIRIGVPAAGGMQLLSGQITIDNGPAYTTLTLDDNNDSNIRNVVIDEVGGYNTVSGMCAALIRFDSTDVSTCTIITGSGNDTVSVPRNDEVLNIVNFGGLDGVTIGNATNGVQSITAEVSISSPFGPNLVTINNGPDTVARTATLQNVVSSGNTYSEWTGLGPAAIRYRDQLAATVTFGSAADTVVVRQTQSDLNLTTTGGVDNYTFGGASNGAQSVLGTITLTNPPDHNIITVSDAGNATARTATLDDATISGAPYGRLTGLAPATINWKYNDTTSINITHGSGADSLAVKRHQKPLTIQGTAGSDTVTIGGVAGVGMNGVTAAVTVSNTSGATTLVLDDSGDTADGVLVHEMNTLLLGRVTGMSPSTIDYRFGQVNTVRLRTSQGGFNSIVVIHETSPLTRVFYDPGAIGEVLQVNDDSIGAAALYTNRSVNPYTTFIGNGGAVYQLQGGFVFRSSVQIMSSGLIDISDGAMINDYDEGNPLEVVHEKIIEGYNGGNWQGFGIRSSTAATTPGSAVGCANATDLFSAFPATFAGQSVDSTTVLVRYTLAGDANLNRAVDFPDLLNVAQNYGQSGRAFSQGDFNYDNNVNFGDLLILAQRYGSTLLVDGTFTPTTQIPQKLMSRYFGGSTSRSSPASTWDSVCADLDVAAAMTLSVARSATKSPSPMWRETWC